MDSRLRGNDSVVVERGKITGLPAGLTRGSRWFAQNGVCAWSGPRVEPVGSAVMREAWSFRRRSRASRTPTLDPSPQGGGCRLRDQADDSAAAGRRVVRMKVTMKVALISRTMVGAGAESMKKLA